MERDVSDTLEEYLVSEKGTPYVVRRHGAKNRNILEAKGWKIRERFAEATIQEIMAKNMKE